MANNKGIGLLLAGGAALVLMSGGKKKKKGSGKSSGRYTPPEDPKKVDVVAGHHLKTSHIPVPKPPLPSKQSPTKKQKGRQRDLNLLGYQFPVTGIDDEPTRRATMEFQNDWNDFVDILRTINSHIDYKEPYTNISTDGLWGSQTQSRVDKARNKFDGSKVYVEELDSSVTTFREMVTGLRRIPSSFWDEDFTSKSASRPDISPTDVKPDKSLKVNVPGTRYCWINPDPKEGWVDMYGNPDPEKSLLTGWELQYQNHLYGKISFKEDGNFIFDYYFDEDQSIVDGKIGNSFYTSTPFKLDLSSHYRGFKKANGEKVMDGSVKLPPGSYLFRRDRVNRHTMYQKADMPTPSMAKAINVLHKKLFG